MTEGNVLGLHYILYIAATGILPSRGIHYIHVIKKGDLGPLKIAS